MSVRNVFFAYSVVYWVVLFAFSFYVVQVFLLPGIVVAFSFLGVDASALYGYFKL